MSLLGQYDDTIISIALLGVGGDQRRGQATTIGADANRIWSLVTTHWSQ